MIAELATILDDFPGAANQTRCFTHILNLVVKSILRQFDLPKNKAQKLNNASKELLQLAGDIEREEIETRQLNSNENDNDDDDNLDGWVDERDDMEEEDQDELDTTVEPVRLVLTKVRITFLYLSIR